MLFGKKGTTKSADVSEADSDTVVISVRLPKAVHAVLQNIAQKRSGLGGDAAELSVPDLVSKAATIYAKEYTDNAAAVLNDAMLDDSPIARLTNAIFVHAIQNEVFEFRVPLDSEATLSAMGLPPFPNHIGPHIVHRLQVMTVVESGTIAIAHDNLRWTMHVAYTSNPGEYPVAQVKIVPEPSLSAVSDKEARD